MSSDFAIKVENLSKCYQIYDRPQDRLLQMITLNHRKYYREFWALKNVSFEIKKGHTVGIVGRNGSGKSTLLQLICGTLNPTTGSIQTNGRIAALLELGSGFNPEFTGRENVYLNASVLGLSDREIDARFDTIAGFADIGDFLEQPIKTYSSGMVVRLAFAVIAHVDAEILVIDEALSVGDVFFAQKCMRYLRDYQINGGTILFVSHDTGAVLSLCDQAILLSGNLEHQILLGDSEAVCKQYLEDLYSDHSRTLNLPQKKRTDLEQTKYSSVKYECDKEIETIFSVSEFKYTSESFGLLGAEIYDAGFFDKSGSSLKTFKGGEQVLFIMRARANQQIQFPAFGFMLKNNLGEYIYTEGTDPFFRSHEIILDQGDSVSATFVLTMPHLIRAKYSMNIAFAEGLGDDHIQHHWIHDAIQIDVIKSRVVHGYSGMHNVKMQIEVLRNNDN